MRKQAIFAAVAGCLLSVAFTQNSTEPEYHAIVVNDSEKRLPKYDTRLVFLGLLAGGQKSVRHRSQNSPVFNAEIFDFDGSPGIPSEATRLRWMTLSRAYPDCFPRICILYIIWG